MKDVEVIKAHNTLSPRARTNFEKRLRVAAYCRVSTDTEDQLNSYKSQVKYYTELIKSKPEWSLAGIYADEAITGTQVKKREDFQRLINDCMNGDVDMVITKSISRFARNTLDTLKYVRMLKDKGVAVFFEEENINTLTMDGELLLVILSSVAQQEVENISANVKKGLKMKMQRGELVGFQGCLGYDYNPADKTITINEEEAAVVRYIFQRYTEGAGGSVIAKELENLGYKTKRGSPKWADSTVIGIIKNEKYKGDILLGKTFTVDPISKRRLYNFGEEDQFYIREHHEPIISEEVFEAAQEILRRRAKPRSLNVDGKREKFSRKYAFSCMIECGFCGGTLTRRSWHSSSQYNKAIWQCVVSTKKGKKFCPESKGVDERTIERAFVESYRLLCQNNKDVLDEFMKRTEETLSESNAGKRLAKAEREIHALEVKKNKLVDMRLEDTIDKETYDRKYLDLSSQIEQLQKECESLQDAAETESTMRKRVATFRQTLEQNEVLDTFDRHIFESIVEKVIVGGYDSNGNKDPYMIVFVYKTGFKNSVDGKNFKPLRKNSKENHSPAVLCSHASNEAESMCSDSSDDTHILSGILKCPCCGRNLYGNVSKAHSKDNKTRYYYFCKSIKGQTGHECSFRLNIEQNEINQMVASIVSAMVHDPRFVDAIKEKIGSAVDTSELEQQADAIKAQLRQRLSTKSRLEHQMDTLDFNDPYYDRKALDLQRRYDEQYERIEDMESQLAEIQGQIDGIHQEKITADNIYHLLLAFDEVYNAATEVEQKEFMRAFIERIDIFPEKQPDGNWIRNIVFAFPVPYNGKEIREFPLESQSTVECVFLMSKVQ